MKRIWWLFLVMFIALVIGLAGWLLPGLPDPSSLPSHLNPPSVRITDRGGRLLYEMLPEDGGRNMVVSLDRIPRVLQQATIATEDDSFYQNPGVDLKGILRAAWINLRGGETRSGGSTITQQVARNLLMSVEERAQRSLRRKLREALLAWRITRAYSKDQILAFYLNQMYYGGLTYGVEAASQTYFGKPVAELDLAESALLAGLPQAPSLYDPFQQLEAARERQSVVLGLMERQGFISAGQRALAEREPLVLASQPYPLEAPHFVMMVRSQIDQRFTPEEIRASGGLVVRTTLNLDWQHEAERAIREQLERLRTQPGSGHNVNNAALVALDPYSAEILAMVGSPDYFDAKHAGAINMALSPRQPGSALKPLIYAAAFDPSSANPLTPASMILDVRTSFSTHDSRAYLPENYDSLEHGPVLAREALASSLNIPAVAVLNQVGLPALFSFANRMGITTLGDPNTADLSIALGGGDVRLLDLTAAYGVFATGGYRAEPYAILDIKDRYGNILYAARPPEPQRVLDQRVAWLISDILSDDSARLLGFGANSVLRLDRPAAVKTGTTTNFHDNWTVGYTPDLVVGVWAGNTSYEGMHDVTGLTGAAPIWHQFIRTVLSGQPERAFIRPAGLVQVEVCSLSGLLPSPACPYKRLEWVIDGTQPTQTDRTYQLVDLDTSTGLLAEASTPPDRRVQVLALDLPPAARPWARLRGLRLVSDLSSAGAAAGEQASTASQAVLPPLRLLAPSSGSIYRLAQNLPLDDQRLRLEAVAGDGLSQVTLWVDGIKLAEPGGPPLEAWWTLSVGQHQAWAEAVNGRGERIESERVAFTVN